MQVHIKKWGNSLAVRLPVHLMNAANFKPDQLVEIHEENGKLIIENVAKSEYTLSALVDGITKENMHSEIDFASAVGREIW